MEKLIQMTAVPMERPESYGAFHLTYTFLVIPLVIFLAWRLRKVGEKGNKIILLSVSGFLFVTEIYKHLLHYYAITDHEIAWWIFSFQLCSMPMYLCPIIAFLKDGKLRDALYNFSLGFNMLGGIMAFIEPSGINNTYWALTFHSYIWHTLLIFVGLYFGFSGRAAKKVKDFKGAVIVYLVLCAIAFSFNLIFREVSGGDVNCFYIGPSPSPLIICKTICEWFGWYVNAPLYIFATSLGAYLLYLPFAKHNEKKLKTEA